MKYDLSKLEKGCESLGISLDQKQKNLFVQFYDMMIETNKVMNLTAITEFEDVVLKHYLDSLACYEFLRNHERKKIIDVGTGAGFPGIPLKIVLEHHEFSLLDSLKKRTDFLNKTIGELKLENVRAFHGRAEDLAHNAEYREQFDFCVSRAVSNLSTLSEYCIPFIKVGGSFISYKSGNAKEEIENAEKAIKLLGGSIEQIKEYTLPDSDIQRTLVVIKKTRQTPKKYPRKAGTPAKEPLS